MQKFITLKNENIAPNFDFIILEFLKLKNAILLNIKILNSIVFIIGIMRTL